MKDEAPANRCAQNDHSPREALALLAGRRAGAPRPGEGTGLAGGRGVAGAIGPILGKHFIDAHVLTRNFELGPDGAAAGGAARRLDCQPGALRATGAHGLGRAALGAALREQVYAHVLAQPMAFFDRSITGQLLSRITNDTDAVKNLYRQVLFVMLDSTIVVAGAVVAMAWLDWRLMLIVLALVPASSGIMWLYQRASSGPVQRARELRAGLNAQMAESMGRHGGAAVGQRGAALRGALRRRQPRAAATHACRTLRANAWLLRPALDLLNVLLIVTVIYGFGLRELSGLEVGCCTPSSPTSRAWSSR